MVCTSKINLANVREAEHKNAASKVIITLVYIVNFYSQHTDEKNLSCNNDMQKSFISRLPVILKCYSETVTRHLSSPCTAICFLSILYPHCCLRDADSTIGSQIGDRM